MSARKLNLPPSWSEMTRHNRAYYLMNSFQAKTWQEAIALSRYSRPKKVTQSQQMLLTNV